MPVTQVTAMSIGQTIRRFGFRKWYERELIQSHLHLILLVLSTLGLLGSAETFSIREPLADQFTTLVCAAASAAIGYYALRRYLYLLNHAEYVADQATCRQCSAYGRLDLLDEARDGARLRVRCRACSNDWTIEL